MAKTFKNTPAPAAANEPAKPISERDFFDLTDEPVAPAKHRQQDDEAVNNSDLAAKPSNTGNTGITSNTAVVATEERDVRQTFVVSSSQLEQLRDYVHARRSQGEYTYSQKQALQEALDLLFAGATPAPPRPAQTRAQEQQRRQRIQRGRRGGE